jgi:hypothetical protein
MHSRMLSNRPRQWKCRGPAESKKEVGRGGLWTDNLHELRNINVICNIAAAQCKFRLLKICACGSKRSNRTSVNEAFERHPTGLCCCFQGCIKCWRALRPFGEVNAKDHVRVSTMGMVLRLYDHPVLWNLGHHALNRRRRTDFIHITFIMIHNIAAMQHNFSFAEWSA